MSTVSIILDPRQLEYLAIWGVRHVDFEHHHDAQYSSSIWRDGVSKMSILSIILKPKQLEYLATWGAKNVDFEHHSVAQAARVSGDLGCQTCRF